MSFISQMLEEGLIAQTSGIESGSKHTGNQKELLQQTTSLLF